MKHNNNDSCCFKTTSLLLTQNKISSEMPSIQSKIKKPALLCPQQRSVLVLPKNINEVVVLWTRIILYFKIRMIISWRNIYLEIFFHSPLPGSPCIQGLWIYYRKGKDWGIITYGFSIPFLLRSNWKAMQKLCVKETKAESCQPPSLYQTE